VDAAVQVASNWKNIVRPAFSIGISIGRPGPVRFPHALMPGGCRDAYGESAVWLRTAGGLGLDFLHAAPKARVMCTRQQTTVAAKVSRGPNGSRRVTIFRVMGVSDWVSRDIVETLEEFLNGNGAWGNDRCTCVEMEMSVAEHARGCGWDSDDSSTGTVLWERGGDDGSGTDVDADVDADADADSGSDSDDGGYGGEESEGAVHCCLAIALGLPVAGEGQVKRVLLHLVVWTPE